MPRNQTHPSTSAKLVGFWHWLDDRLLLICSGVLLAFIPLYPKLPLFDIIPGYIVRVRLEDLLILISLGVLVGQLLRHKISLKTPLTLPVTAYAISGLLSIISAVFIIHTVPLQLLHLGKTTLHYLRYLEYFSLFFITYSAVKTKKDFFKLLTIVFVVLVGVTIYGVGQKYFYWPVYSTMNREFSKGIRLYLMPHARVQSTFAGHYDLGAYLVIVLPLLAGLIAGLKNQRQKLGLNLIFWFGVWLLVVSAARTSFVSFIFAMFSLITSLTIQKKTWRAKASYFFSRHLYLVFGLLIIMLIFGNDLSERLAQVIESNPSLKTKIEQLKQQKEKTQQEVFIALGLKKIKKPEPPKNAISTQEVTQIILRSDQRPSPKRPRDVYVDIPIKEKVATKSAEGKTVIKVVTKERTYSNNALKYGLSLGIRLDALWPQAIKGFLRNPLLGSGYATLNKTAVWQFTEADGTDNNYLRTLGETGLLGFIIFYGTVIYVIKLTLNLVRNTQDLLIKTIGFGFIAATLGLLINAIYIDVFAASKVAMTYWAVTGLVLALTKPTILKLKTNKS